MELGSGDWVRETQESADKQTDRGASRASTAAYLCTQPPPPRITVKSTAKLILMLLLLSSRSRHSLACLQDGDNMLYNITTTTRARWEYPKPPEPHQTPKIQYEEGKPRLSPTLSPNLARYTKEKPRSARGLGRACDVLEHFASDHAARLDVHGNHEVRLTQHRAGQGKIAAMWWCPLPKGEEKKKTHLARYTLALPSHRTYLHRSWEGCRKNKEEKAWSTAFERTSATPSTAVERDVRGGRRRGEQR